LTAKLIFRAGPKALLKIKDGGLHPADVKVVAGAAGGPKWLILGHLDRFLFTDFFKDRREPLFVIGASSGAWRFAAASQADPLAAIQRFQDAYIGQSYNDRPSPEDVSAEAGKILKHLLGKQGALEILSHPFLRLNFMTVRSRGLTQSERKAHLFLGLCLAVGGNFIHRKSLGWFFQRGLFSNSRHIPPFAGMPDLPISRIPLTLQNMGPGLLASGSIPLIMAGVTGIPGAPQGVYRDGGVTDYHMDIPFLGRAEGIVLFPHYQERVVPGWFDKQIPWRKPKATHMEKVLLLAPSAAMVASLPGGKIPDRNDFYTYRGKDRERMADWRKAVEISRGLADEFAEVVLSGKIREIVRPLPL